MLVIKHVHKVAREIVTSIAIGDAACLVVEAVKIQNTVRVLIALVCLVLPDVILVVPTLAQDGVMARLLVVGID